MNLKYIKKAQIFNPAISCNIYVVKSKLFMIKFKGEYARVRQSHPLQYFILKVNLSKNMAKCWKTLEFIDYFIIYENFGKNLNSHASHVAEKARR